jgi:hypothetical protein
VRRRGRGIGWPSRLAEFREAEWPRPDIGPDPGSAGLGRESRDLTTNTDLWLAQIQADYGDEGLTAAWSTTFSYRRWVAARLAWLGKDHPQYMDYWLTDMGTAHQFVPAYVQWRDREAGRKADS